MAIENRNQVLCSRTEDAKEGMRAFVEKRQPITLDDERGLFAAPGGNNELIPFRA